MNAEQTKSAAAVMAGARYNDKGECVNVEYKSHNGGWYRSKHPSFNWYSHEWRIGPIVIDGKGIYVDRNGKEWKFIGDSFTSGLQIHPRLIDGEDDEPAIVDVAGFRDGDTQPFIVRKKESNEQVAPLDTAEAPDGLEWVGTGFEKLGSAEIPADVPEVWTVTAKGVAEFMEELEACAPKPIIDGPGLYERADGEVVEVHSGNAFRHHPWKTYTPIPMGYKSDGTSTAEPYDDKIHRILRKHVPKLQIEEGKWYKRRDGELVGPAKNRYAIDLNYPWSLMGNSYATDGTYSLDVPSRFDLISEAPAPVKTSPWSKPEDVPAGMVWIRKIGQEANHALLTGVGNDGISASGNRIDWHDLYIFTYSSDRKTWLPCTTTTEENK